MSAVMKIYLYIRIPCIYRIIFFICYGLKSVVSSFCMFEAWPHWLWGCHYPIVKLLARDKCSWIIRSAGSLLSGARRGDGLTSIPDKSGEFIIPLLINSFDRSKRIIIKLSFGNWFIVTKYSWKLKSAFDHYRVSFCCIRLYKVNSVPASSEKADERAWHIRVELAWRL